MSAAKKKGPYIPASEDVSDKEILTYDEYIKIFPAWSQKTIERRMEKEDFPGKKVHGVLYISRKAVALWWKKRGIG